MRELVEKMVEGLVTQERSYGHTPYQSKDAALCENAAMGLDGAGQRARAEEVMVEPPAMQVGYQEVEVQESVAAVLCEYQKAQGSSKELTVPFSFLTSDRPKSCHLGGTRATCLLLSSPSVLLSPKKCLYHPLS